MFRPLRAVTCFNSEIRGEREATSQHFDLKKKAKPFLTKCLIPPPRLKEL